MLRLSFIAVTLTVVILLYKLIDWIGSRNVNIYSKFPDYSRWEIGDVIYTKSHGTVLLESVCEFGIKGTVTVVDNAGNETVYKNVFISTSNILKNKSK